jgi:hypothetical protein
VAEPRNSSNHSNPRFEEARRALDRKWALIALDGKIPLHKGWQKKAPADLSEVQQWITKGHNIGLRTGKVSGVIVIDDDSPDGSATAAMELPLTVTAITGSGKRHYYFAAPADFSVGNSVKTLAEGIDVRGDGGQVVFVGSLHPDTNKPYVWAPGCSPDDLPLAALPEDLLQKLRPVTKPRMKIVKDTQPEDDPAANQKRINAYVRAAIQGEIATLHASVEGARNSTLNKCAFALGQLVGAGALDREVARSALYGAAIAIGLSGTETTATLDSGLDAGAQEPRDLNAMLQEKPHQADHGVPHDRIDTRPGLVVRPGWLHEVVSKAERIALSQHPPVLYQRGTTLATIAMLPEAGAGRSIRHRPRIQEMQAHGLVDRLTSLISWVRIDRKTGETVPIDCPERVALTLLSRAGSWKLLPLLGVIDSPTLRHDGSPLEKEGYDLESGLFLALGGDSWPSIPDRPTREDSNAALAKLMWIVKDFPFLEEADRSVAVAAILTALIRPSLRTAPLFSFRAAKMGSGKSLLADIVSLIAAGRQAAVMSQGADENEDKKRMLPILAEGDPVAVIDNIERPFGSAALCSILTQTTWRDRVLGKSQTLSLPTTNTTWIATGNNIVFDGDITTRTLVCDLDPRCERPEERKFEINLHAHIPQHRAELVVAGLTVLRAYHVAGRPDMELSVFGRFEEWSDWIRSALVWSGLADPCDTRRRVEEADPVRAQIGDLLAALHDQFCESPFQVSDVIHALKKTPTLDDVITPILASARPGQSTAQCLGLFFQRIDRRPEGGIRLTRGATRGGSATWRIENV